MTFMKIKRISLYGEKRNVVVIHLRNGDQVYYTDENGFVGYQTGEVYQPVYDEFTNELTGFIQ